MNYMKQQGKLIAVDLDDTLCYRPEGLEHLGRDKYLHCLPLEANIEVVNKLYNAGHEIVIYTARGMYTYNMDVGKVYANLYLLTRNQLESWGVSYTRLVMGKQPYDYLLDDKSIQLDNIAYLTRYC